MSAYRLSKKILGDEPPKKALLFALFKLCSQEELDQLEYLYGAELQEWLKHERAQVPDDPEEIKKQLGF